jgi:hypothetical protein
MLTRLGESGADAFTIMRIAGHSNVTISQRYVHPSPETQETAIGRMDALNASRREEGSRVPAKVPTSTANVETKKQDKPFVVNKKGA